MFHDWWLFRRWETQLLCLTWTKSSRIDFVLVWKRISLLLKRSLKIVLTIPLRHFGILTTTIFIFTYSFLPFKQTQIPKKQKKNHFDYRNNSHRKKCSRYHTCTKWQSRQPNCLWTTSHTTIKHISHLCNLLIYNM